VGLSGSIELTCVAHTGAGIAALWDPASFATITDYDTWEAALLEDDDVVRYIERGSLVPICIGADFAGGVVVRCAANGHPAELTERERTYLYVSSEPYLFVSTGVGYVSGYEAIDNSPPPDLPRLDVPTGRHVATIHLLDWDAEPGASDEHGNPTEHALPDFVVLLNPEIGPQPNYRTNVESFERSDIPDFED